MATARTSRHRVLNHAKRRPMCPCQDGAAPNTYPKGTAMTDLKIMPDPTVTGLDMAFGARAMELLPPWDEIPEDFRAWGGRGEARSWVKFQERWFFSGLPRDTEFKVVEGVDAKQAFAHLRAIQGSFEPKHEHKTAGVAYLASLWFVEVPGGAA